MSHSYYGNLEPIQLHPNKSVAKMTTDDLLIKIVQKACDDLIAENHNKWMHFERRMMVELNLLKERLKDINKKLDRKD